MIQLTNVQLKMVFVTVLIAVILGCGFILYTVRLEHIISGDISHFYSSLRNSGHLQQPKEENNATRDFSNTTHIIVMFNQPYWMHSDFNAFLSTECAFRNCLTTTDRSNLQNQSAIIFFLTSAPALPNKPPLSPYRRSKEQVWIFAWFEAPINHNGIRAVYKNPHWRDTPNWTMSYSQDADIVSPISKVTKRIPPAKNYSEIFHKKTKQAAWVVSHCITKGRREEYVEILRKHGLSVDQYGRCSGNRIEEEKVKELINSHYKFYLSFENSLCKDYITEKFDKYFNLDTILVVRGGGNYSKLLPKKTFINTNDFSSIKDLAIYLKKVSSSEQHFTKYLRNKDGYIASHDSRLEAVCDVCVKLNNLDKNRKVYRNLIEMIHNGTCVEPGNIHIH